MTGVQTCALPIYDEVWEKAAGFVPKERGGLAAMLDESAIRHCGLKMTS